MSNFQKNFKEYSQKVKSKEIVVEGIKENNIYLYFIESYFKTIKTSQKKFVSLSNSVKEQWNKFKNVESHLSNKDREVEFARLKALQFVVDNFNEWVKKNDME